MLKSPFETPIGLKRDASADPKFVPGENYPGVSGVTPTQLLEGYTRAHDEAAKDFAPDTIGSAATGQHLRHLLGCQARFLTIMGFLNLSFEQGETRLPMAGVVQETEANTESGVLMLQQLSRIGESVSQMGDLLEAGKQLFLTAGWAAHTAAAEVARAKAQAERAEQESKQRAEQEAELKRMEQELAERKQAAEEARLQQMRMDLLALGLTVAPIEKEEANEN